MNDGKRNLLLVGVFSVLAGLMLGVVLEKHHARIVGEQPSCNNAFYAIDPSTPPSRLFIEELVNVTNITTSQGGVTEIFKDPVGHGNLILIARGTNIGVIRVKP